MPTTLAPALGAPSLAPTQQHALRSRPRWPGLALALALALVASYAASFPAFSSLGLSTLTLAIVIGMVLGNTAYPRFEAQYEDGIGFSKHWLLRAGIVLYGLRLTPQDLLQVGVQGVLIDAAVIASTFALAMLLGRRWLGLDRETTVLIGAGSSICGAAAVLATQSVVRARADQVSVAIATVVVFGTLSMFIYPHLLDAWCAWLGTPEQFGVYIGSTVHEVAQVVAAAEATGPAMLDDAVIAKMVRVMMLAPFLVLLSLSFRRQGAANGARGGVTVPWFAFGFIGVVAARHFVTLPPDLHSWLLWLDGLLLAMAMASLGLTTRVSALRKAGAKPLVLAAVLFAWLLIGGALINAGVQFVVS